MKKYQVSFNLVHREQDNFENGCFGESIQQELSSPIVLQADSIIELMVVICDRFNVSADNIELNSCDETGRIDVQTMTHAKLGMRDVYKRYEQRFISGECNLWLNCFIGTCTTVPHIVDLSEYQ